LAQQGKRVEVIEAMGEAAEDLNPVSRILLLELLAKQKVRIRTRVKLEEILDDGAITIDKEWNREKIIADSVVLAMGLIPRIGIVKDWERLASEVYAVGDCVNPRKLMDAIHEGYNAAVEI